MSALRDERARARYARAIERRLAEREERPIVLSPRDWTRISGWHAAGVPLALVLESIDAAFEPKRRRGRARPRSLAYVATLVDESWRIVLDGRRGSSAAEQSSIPPDRLTLWRRYRDRTPPDSALRALLDRLLETAAHGAQAETLDTKLDAELPRAVPADVASEAERAADRSVARLRGRVPVEEIERARSLAAVSWLRQRLGLPRLVS